MLPHLLLPLGSGVEEVLSEETRLAQKPLTLQGEDHQVTTANWALRPPIPRSHIWRNGGGSGGNFGWSPEPRPSWRGPREGAEALWFGNVSL